MLPVVQDFRQHDGLHESETVNWIMGDIRVITNITQWYQLPKAEVMLSLDVDQYGLTTDEAKI
ncbi:hypothetical protein ACFLWX_02100 [Chloroflexota bacterium]